METYDHTMMNSIKYPFHVNFQNFSPASIYLVVMLYNVAVGRVQK